MKRCKLPLDFSNALEHSRTIVISFLNGLSLTHAEARWDAALMLGARLATMYKPVVEWHALVSIINSQFDRLSPLFSLGSVLQYISQQEPDLTALHLVVDELQATLGSMRPCSGTEHGRNAPHEKLSLAIHRCANDHAIAAPFFMLVTYACTAVDPSELSGNSSQFAAPKQYGLGALSPAAAQAILEGIPNIILSAIVPLLGGNARAIVFLRTIANDPSVHGGFDVPTMWSKLETELAHKWNVASLPSPLLPLLALSGIPVERDMAIGGHRISSLPEFGIASLEPVPGASSLVVLKSPPALLLASLASFGPPGACLTIFGGSRSQLHLSNSHRQAS